MSDNELHNPFEDVIDDLEEIFDIHMDGNPFEGFFAVVMSYFNRHGIETDFQSGDLREDDITRVEEITKNGQETTVFYPGDLFIEEVAGYIIKYKNSSQYVSSNTDHG